MNAFTLNDNKSTYSKNRPIESNNLENDIIIQVNQIVESANMYLIDEQTSKLDLYKLYTYFDYYVILKLWKGYGLTIYDNMVLGNKIISILLWRNGLFEERRNNRIRI